MKDFIIVKEKFHRIQRINFSPEYTLLYCKELENQEIETTGDKKNE